MNGLMYLYSIQNYVTYNQGYFLSINLYFLIPSLLVFISMILIFNNFKDKLLSEILETH